MMLRCFLPVGQGAFYLERFKSNGDIINVVYDCGSLTDVKIVEKEIRSNFRKGDEIETVFISHIDNDHINGLEYLLKYCTVKNIVFPYTKREDKIALAIDYFCKNNNASNNDFTYRFITNPYGAVYDAGSEARLYGVREFGDRHRLNREYDLENDEIRIIESGENISKYIFKNKNICNKQEWEYVPFNFRELEREKQFLNFLEDNLNNIGITLKEINDLLKSWNNEKIRNSIIDAYKKVEGNVNTNSMVLFSGSRNYYMLQKPIGLFNSYYNYCRFCYNKRLDFGKKNGCLYTGDYEANGVYKWRDLKNAFSKYWDFIGCVQIPHHGSYRNYNHEFSLFDAYFIISAGCKNRFRHPSGLVIKDLYLNGKYPLIVTEHRNSEIIFEIDI